MPDPPFDDANMIGGRSVNGFGINRGFLGVEAVFYALK
jgi:hypothetical protein